MKLNPFRKRKPLVSVLRLEGLIAAGGKRRPVLNDESLGSSIDKAFTRHKPAAVALVINSPGGSPVQSSLIASRIRRLADKHSVPVHAFVEDLAVSGGYWIAVAADEIHADACSVIGSIGVISSSFGFHGALEKIGIQRRVYKAGKNKSMLDPFLPEEPDDVARLRRLQDSLHEKFIDHVKVRRGSKLTGEDLFTGEFWLAGQALKLGLIDGLATVVPKMQELFGEEVRFRHYSRKLPFPANIGVGASAAAADLIEERLLRSQFGS